MIAIRATSSRPKQGTSVRSRRVDTAPVGVALRLIVANSSGGHYLLPYPRKQTASGWVNAATGAPLALHPTHWQHHVETLPNIRAGARRLPVSEWRDWFLVNAWGTKRQPRKRNIRGAQRRAFPSPGQMKCPPHDLNPNP